VELCVRAKVLQAHDSSFNGKTDISFTGSSVALSYRSNIKYATSRQSPLLQQAQQHALRISSHNYINTNTNRQLSH